MNATRGTDDENRWQMYADLSPEQEHGNIAASVAYFRRMHIPYHAAILDVGTHRGSFPAQLMRLGYTNTYGIDVNPAPITYGQHQYPALADRLKLYDGFHIPFNDATFDAVTLFDVLEHFPQPSQQLHEIRRVLKPGGVLVFQTPNRITNILWEIIQLRSLIHWRTYHCSLQTCWSLHRLLRKVGFVAIWIEKYNVFTPYNLQKVRRVLGPLGPPLLRIAALAPLAVYPNFWGRCERDLDN